MPNWCNNVLQVLDDKKIDLKKDLNKFKDETGDIDFQKILPCPEEFYKDDRWYNWCVNNWGTKWSCDGCSFSEDGKSVSFSTAWSPPIGVVKELSKILDCDLRLIYSEPGMNFHGEYQVFKDGYISDDCYSLEELPEELKEELAEVFGLFEHEEEDV